MLLRFSLMLFTFMLLAGCDATTSAVIINITPKFPAQPVISKFYLSARQGLRDLTGDFSVHVSGADTGILLLPGEKVEVFASGTANLQSGGSASGPDGSSSCRASTMPEPSLPCYSVIYSIGVNGRAGEVGKHVPIIPDNIGNLFLGVNSPHLASNSGSFHMTVLTIPPGTATGLWVKPDDRFNSQGTSMTLSAYVFGQNVAKLSVQFTLTAPGQTPVTICQDKVSDVDIYSCAWDFTLNNALLPNGPVTLGFTVTASRQSDAALAPSVNPDGLRAGRITYEQTQPSTNYAGYAATDLNETTSYQKVTGSWTVPPVSCSPGELSASAIWVGMTSRDETNKSLLAQLGTDSDCQGGFPNYYLWWEIFPAPATNLQLPLQPGYVATATVTFQQGTFQLSIDVPNEGDHFSINQPGVISSTSLAECIVEAPFLVDNPATGQGHIIQLTNFGLVSVSCQINNNDPVADGPQDYVYQMQTDFGVSKATTSVLDSSGTTFTVTWNHG
jgi:hypothetical protein